MIEVLVIGYGNTLRGDDGAGYRVAELVADWEFVTVRSLPVHQLTPELAIELAQAQTVLFVDAIAPPALSPAPPPPLSPHPLPLIPLLPADDGDILEHQADPRSLLALTQALYHVTPTAYHLLIPAHQFEFTETFSAIAQAGIQAALITIQTLIEHPTKITI